MGGCIFTEAGFFATIVGSRLRTWPNSELRSDLSFGNGIFTCFSLTQIPNRSPGSAFQRFSENAHGICPLDPAVSFAAPLAMFYTYKDAFVDLMVPSSPMC